MRISSSALLDLPRSPLTPLLPPLSQLSAVDAHVSKTLVDCFTTGPLAKKTRILVTHHLEVLPEADLIITVSSLESSSRRVFCSLTVLFLSLLDARREDRRDRNLL